MSTGGHQELGGRFVIGGDMPVARLGYGAMRLTGQPGNYGPYRDLPAGRRLLRTAVDLGVTFIDTADAYGPGTSESLIADALFPYPESLVIATKVGVVKPTADPATWHPDGSPDHLRAAVDASLTRLRRERIDLLQLHRPDPSVPIEESVGALADLQRQGKVRHIGVSNVDANLLARARSAATIVSVQNRFCLADRGDADLVASTARDGIAFIPYGPLGAHPLHDGVRLPQDTLVESMARRYDASPAQIALAWLLSVSSNALPIPGTTSVAHLEENIAAARIDLAEQDRRALTSLGR